MKQERFFGRYMLVALMCMIAMGFTAMRAEAEPFPQEFDQRLWVDDLSDWEPWIENSGAYELVDPDKVLLTVEEQSFAEIYKAYDGAHGVMADIDVDVLDGDSHAGIAMLRFATSAEGNRIDTRIMVHSGEEGYFIYYFVVDRVARENLCEDAITMPDNPVLKGIQLGIARVDHKVHFVATGYDSAACVLDEGVEFTSSPVSVMFVDAGEGRVDALFQSIKILYGPHKPQDTPGLTNAQWISSFYAAYWGRAGDPGGLDYWLNEVSNGATDIPGVAENFALSAEAKAMYPYFNDPDAATDAERTTFVQAVYQNLLGRDVPENDQGVQYWVEMLRTGQTTPGLVIGNIIYSAIQADGRDWLTIWNKIQAAEYFTQGFEASGRVWQESDMDLARLAVEYILDDPATLESAKARIDQFFQQFDGEPLTPTTILGDWNWISSYYPDENGTMVFQADGLVTGTMVQAGGTDTFSGIWELSEGILTVEFDDGEMTRGFVFGNAESFTYHTSAFPLTFTRP